MASFQPFFRSIRRFPVTVQRILTSNPRFFDNVKSNKATN